MISCWLIALKYRIYGLGGGKGICHLGLYSNVNPHRVLNYSLWIKGFISILTPSSPMWQNWQFPHFPSGDLPITRFTNYHWRDERWGNSNLINNTDRPGSQRHARSPYIMLSIVLQTNRLVWPLRLTTRPHVWGQTNVPLTNYPGTRTISSPW